MPLYALNLIKYPDAILPTINPPLDVLDRFDNVIDREIEAFNTDTGEVWSFVKIDNVIQIDHDKWEVMIDREVYPAPLSYRVKESIDSIEPDIIIKG